MDDLSIDITGHIQRQLTMVATTAQETPALRKGTYDVWCSADCWIRTGHTGVAADANEPGAYPALTDVTGYKVPVGSVMPVKLNTEADKIGVYTTVSATFSYHRTR